jgi:chromosome segregation ATPase
MSNEKSKTADEILKKAVFKLSNVSAFQYEILEAMEQYASQQTKPLEDKIKELDLECTKLQDYCSSYLERIAHLDTKIESLTYQLAEKDKEIEFLRNVRIDQNDKIMELDKEIERLKENN